MRKINNYLWYGHPIVFVTLIIWLGDKCMRKIEEAELDVQIPREAVPFILILVIVFIVVHGTWMNRNR